MAETEAETGFMSTAWKAQHWIEGKIDSLGKGRYARVLRMTRKPEPDEFRQSSTIVLVGIGVIGLIGFLVYKGMKLLLETVL